MQPHEFWQEIEPAATLDAEGVAGAFHAAMFEDARVLRPPIRSLAARPILARDADGKWRGAAEA